MIFAGPAASDLLTIFAGLLASRDLQIKHHHELRFS